MGNKEALGPGGVQYMSAGITHSEMNERDVTCRFMQVWFMPDASGHTPQYGSSTYSKEQRHNVLLRILRGSGTEPSTWPTVKDGEEIHLHQDANVYVSETDSGVSHKIVLDVGRQAYLVCIDGVLKLGLPDKEIMVDTRDGVEIVAAPKTPLHVELTAGDKGSHFMLLEMSQRPKVAGW